MSIKHVSVVVAILLIAASVASVSAAGIGTSNAASAFPKVAAFLDSVKTPVGVALNVLFVAFSFNHNYSPTTFNFNFVR